MDAIEFVFKTFTQFLPGCGEIGTHQLPVNLQDIRNFADVELFDDSQMHDLLLPVRQFTYRSPYAPTEFAAHDEQLWRGLRAKPFLRGLAEGELLAAKAILPYVECNTVHPCTSRLRLPHGEPVLPSPQE